MDKFKGKKIAVLGLGMEGLSSAQFLVRECAGVTILDCKKEEELNQERVKVLRNLNIRILTGGNYLKNLNNFDIIVRSPGIRFNTEELCDAEKKGTVITSQTKLFFDLCPCPIIGVTGTKGKGTTSSLIFEMLKKQGIDAYLGGNIGTPPLDFLKNLNESSLVVLELSSFQLQDLAKSPHIAVVLMITSEHLDYHKDVNEYVDAKRNILRFQTADDYAIVNRDYPASNESDIFTQGKVFFVSREREVDEGCFVRGDDVWWRVNGLEEKLVSSSDILLPGRHNLENVCSAVMAAVLAGVSKENIASVLKTFKGLEHRLELVGEINGVKYYDDSFSTTPETAVAAIQAFKNPEILILGGSSKGSDFTELGRVIGKSENIKAIIGIGDEWQKIKSKIYDLNSYSSSEAKRSREVLGRQSSRQAPTIKIIEGCKDMSEVVEKAAEVVEQGDVVLLSPACASFGMFRNYKDRGEQFKREVNNLKS